MVKLRVGPGGGGLTCRLVGVLGVVGVVVGCSGGPGPTLVDEPPRSLGSTAETVATTTTVTAAAPVAPTTTTTAAAPEPEPSSEWTLLAGGDVLMDRSEAAGIDPFEFIEPSLASADIAVVNAEMTISDRGSPVDKAYVFRAPPAAAERMAAAGVDAASLANNHARDYGADALLDTVALLEAAGVVALGAGADDTAAYDHRVLHVAGDVRVALVGASMVVPWDFAAGPDWPGIASGRPATRLLETVRDAARAADVVIVFIHWGIERQTCPTAEQLSLARQLLTVGADAVIGHHPHVLQPIEFAGGKLVAYSLGNFVWHPRSGITGETGVLQIDFDADRIVGWAFHPHLLDEHGAPRPAESGRRVDRIRDIIGGNCAPHTPPPVTTTTTTEAGVEAESEDEGEGEGEAPTTDPDVGGTDAQPLDDATTDTTGNSGTGAGPEEGTE